MTASLTKQNVEGWSANTVMAENLTVRKSAKATIEVVPPEWQQYFALPPFDTYSTKADSA